VRREPPAVHYGVEPASSRSTQSAFSNDITGPISNGSFGLQLNGNDLDLVYTAAVPRTASLGVLSLGASLDGSPTPPSAK